MSSAYRTLSAVESSQISQETVPREQTCKNAEAHDVCEALWRQQQLEADLQRSHSSRTGQVNDVFSLSASGSAWPLQSEKQRSAHTSRPFLVLDVQFINSLAYWDSFICNLQHQLHGSSQESPHVPQR